MQTHPGDATNNQVLAELAKLNGRFDGLEGRFNGFEEGQKGLIERVDDLTEAIQDFASDVDKRFNEVDQRFNRLETDMTKVKATMVTKDYLDEKLAIHHSDLVLRMQKEDQKTLEMARGR